MLTKDNLEALNYELSSLCRKYGFYFDYAGCGTHQVVLVPCPGHTKHTVKFPDECFLLYNDVEGSYLHEDEQG